MIGKRLLARAVMVLGLIATLAPLAPPYSPAGAVVILDSTWRKEGGTKKRPWAGFEAHIRLAVDPRFLPVLALSSDEETWGEASATWIGNDATHAYILTAAHIFQFNPELGSAAAFSKAMGKVNLGQVKPRAVRAYLDGKGPVTRHWHRKWETLRPFYGFAMTRGLVRRSPLPARAPKLDITFTAYIYTQEELKALLQAITPKRTDLFTPATNAALSLR